MYKLENNDPLIAYEQSFYSVYNDHYKNIQPADGKPVAVFCAGQPGSGKSKMTSKVKKRLEKAIVIDTDTFRTFHPKYNDVMKQNPELAYELLDDFSYKASDKLIDLAIKENKNLIFDGTLGGNNIEKTIETANKLKAAGYTVEIAALSINPEWSLTGTFFRYESQMSDTGMGRTVSSSYHNEVYARIPYNIDKLFNTGVIDEGTIYARNYKSNKIELIESLSLKGDTNKEQFKSTFNNERERKLDLHEFASLKSFKNSTSQLIIKRLQSNSSECSQCINNFKDACKIAEELNFKKDIKKDLSR